VGMLEEIFTHTDCHTLDLAEWFGEEETPTEIVGGNEWVVLVAMFENLIGLFQLFCVLCCWDKVTDGHDVVPF
jgi:hypothetical protein